MAEWLFLGKPPRREVSVNAWPKSAQCAAMSLGRRAVRLPTTVTSFTWAQGMCRLGLGDDERPFAWVFFFFINNLEPHLRVTLF
jgi:hypothetical protein